MFTISPGVAIREIDLTTVVTAAILIEAGFAGAFKWGPVLERVAINNEEHLANVFGYPDDNNYKDFFVAFSYLAYSNLLRTVRIGNNTVMMNASGSGGQIVLNDDDYNITDLTGDYFLAKYPGDLGNSLSVSVCTSADEYLYELDGTFAVTQGSKDVVYTPGSTDTDLTENFNSGDFLVIGQSRYEVASITDATNLKLSRVFGSVTNATATASRLWKYALSFGKAPVTNEAHLVVVDTNGKFTKENGAILESFGFLSTVPGTKNPDGTAAYIVDAINRGSVFIRCGLSSASSNGTDPVDLSGVNVDNKVTPIGFTGGDDGFSSLTAADYIEGYNLFDNPEAVDVPLLIAPASDSVAIIPNHIIQNIAEVRKDTIVFISPRQSDVVNNKGNEVDECIKFRNLLPRTSYAELHCNWKYIYDKYNDVFRWVPLSGDIAGLYAATTADRDAWFSAAGHNRGHVKNVVKLAWNPNRPQRDDLYVNEINAITDFPGDGPLLYGDQTLYGANSAFGFVNIRRLFIVLEKSIANAAKLMLFEFNDEFTRAQFSSTVEPFLRDIKGRRGITYFHVLVDETVNTPQIIDEGKFVGRIFVNGNRSIQNMRLDFVAIKSGVQFSEVIITD